MRVVQLQSSLKPLRIAPLLASALSLLACGGDAGGKANNDPDAASTGPDGGSLASGEVIGSYWPGQGTTLCHEWLEGGELGASDLGEVTLPPGFRHGEPCPRGDDLLGTCTVPDGSAFPDFYARWLYYPDSKSETSDPVLQVREHEDACQRLTRGGANPPESVEATFERAPWVVEELAPPLEDVVALSASASGGCAASASRGVYCWGDNDKGQLGIGSVDDALHKHPEPNGLTDVVAMRRSDWGTCALTGAGELWCWGNGSAPEGQDPQAPVRVEGLPGIRTLAEYDPFQTRLIAEDGTLWFWGETQPTLIQKEHDWYVNLKMVSGDYLLHDDGTLDDEDIFEPAQNIAADLGPLSGLSSHTELILGKDSICIVTADALRCGPSLEDLGSVPAPDGVISLSAPCGVLANHELWCDNERVLEGVQAVAASALNTCVVMTDGSVRCREGSAADFTPIREPLAAARASSAP